MPEMYKLTAETKVGGFLPGNGHTPSIRLDSSLVMFIVANFSSLLHRLQIPPSLYY